jgi:hypothetical protein
MIPHGTRATYLAEEAGGGRIRGENQTEIFISEMNFSAQGGGGHRHGDRLPPAR